MFFTTIQAGWLLAFWFVFQLLSGFGSSPTEGGVAFWAHVGGFVAGLRLICVLRDQQFKTRLGAGRPGRSRMPETIRRRGPWS